jgi:hypothetical protein
LKYRCPSKAARFKLTKKFELVIARIVEEADEGFDFGDVVGGLEEVVEDANDVRQEALDLGGGGGGVL